MADEMLLVDLAGPTATLTLNRPQVLNALNHQLFSELEAALDELAASDDVRVILLTGAGEKAFAAGADIAELAHATAAEGQQIATVGQRVMRKMERMGKPVIACVNGFALGGGCELAMACTLRLASEQARFGQPEVKLGLIPGYGGSQRLPRLIGQGAALKLLLTGEMISAAEALRLGLVEEVLPATELLPRAQQMATTIASMAPVAIRHCLDAVYTAAELPLEAGLAYESALFGLCCATEDKAEGTTAFLEKRAAKWRGR